MSRSCCSIWADEENPRRTSTSTVDKPVVNTAAQAATDSAALDNAPTMTVSDWLVLAAAPTFGAMALLTAIMAGPAETLCSSAMGMPLGGMVLMYLLMSAFHLAPWLKLVRADRSATR